MGIFLLIFIVLFGVFRINLHDTKFTPHKMRMVQCNLTQTEKGNRELAKQNFWKHLGYSISKDKLDFIVWPEASLPYLYNERRADLQEAFQAVLRPGVHLILGAVREDLDTHEIYNSIVVVNHLGENVGCYDKIHLVPFGEYIPFRSFVPTPLQGIAADIGDFAVGKSPRVLEINGLKMAMAICYEAAFSMVAPSAFSAFPKCVRDVIAVSKLLQQEKMPVVQPPTVSLVINVTNDAWFGPTSEPYQHLQIVRARAVELGVPLVRCTNYGISAVFDPCGREICRIPMNSAGFVDFYIPEKLLGETPYKKYGDILFWLMILAVAGIVSYRQTKRLFHSPPSNAMR
ncbi:hypothetical protein FACS189449_06380 [Alphaproteobacteria bacterium]|nr:hypothetical protein FACS189449_06380 [Alphaproteobacteria bacterium]